MAQIGFLASSLLTGLTLLVIVVFIARLRNWQRNAAGTSMGGGVSVATDGWMDRAMRSETTWIVAFVGLVLAFGGGAVLYVSGPSIAGVSQQTLLLALGAAVVVVLTAYLFLGVYVSARARGQKSSFAAMIGAWVLGLLLVAAISLQLLMAG